MLQAHEAANEQTGADEQHDRDRHLAGDEEASQPSPRQSETAIALRVPGAGFENRIEIEPRRTQRRRQAKQNTGEQRHREGEREHVSVDADPVDEGNVPWIDDPDGAESERGDEQTRDAAH
ncbi:MAG TPA: hypothetical protein VFU90_00480, partial [Candidatus Tumulicola sp.]|nr:hypothetical protein [Candidatus Tumulicola sp.]